MKVFSLIKTFRTLEIFLCQSFIVVSFRNFHFYIPINRSRLINMICNLLLCSRFLQRLQVSHPWLRDRVNIFKTFHFRVDCCLSRNRNGSGCRSLFVSGFKTKSVINFTQKNQFWNFISQGPVILHGLLLEVANSQRLSINYVASYVTSSETEVKVISIAQVNIERYETGSKVLKQCELAISNKKPM